MKVLVDNFSLSRLSINHKPFVKVITIHIVRETGTLIRIDVIQTWCVSKFNLCLFYLNILCNTKEKVDLFPVWGWGEKSHYEVGIAGMLVVLFGGTNCIFW